MLLRVAGERGVISTRRLGYWLKGKAGRIVGGLRIVRAGEDRNSSARWKLARSA